MSKNVGCIICPQIFAFESVFFQSCAQLSTFTCKFQKLSVSFKSLPAATLGKCTELSKYTYNFWKC